MGMPLIFGIVLVAILSAISWIDIRRMMVPDTLNLALAAAGLAFQSLASPAPLWLHTATGAAMLATFWLVRHMHAAATGRIGLGLGDVKMAGAAGIWISPWSLPLFVFAASSAALAFMAGRHVLHQRIAADTRQPFGPFLSAGLLLTWLAEQQFPSLRGLLG
jgi:prepilin signal peptidase PulO-like enzyme (type II secretory pathway)